MKPNFIWIIHGMGERKFVQMVQVTWPRWPPCPYMVTTLKNFLLWNQMADDLESWYTVSGTRVLLSLFKWCPWVDVDLFYGKVKFDSNLKQWIFSSPIIFLVSSTLLNIFFSETTGLIEAKFHMESPWDGIMKVGSNGPGHMIKMATMPIYMVKTLKIFSAPESNGQWPWNFICSIRCPSTTKFVQMMTLDWPWLILR